MNTTGRFLGAAVAVWLSSGCASAPREAAIETVDDGAVSQPGFYTAQQASRGSDAFSRACSECHAISEFRGRDFEWRWRRRSAWNLYRTMSETMPEDNPGALPAQTYVDVLAYILQLNDYAAGGSELGATQAAMDRIPLGPGASKTPTLPTSHDP